MGDLGAYVIPVIGTQHAGKTELCHAIQLYLTGKYGLSAYVLDEIVRASPHKTRTQSTTQSQQFILEVEERMINALRGLFDVIIADRIFLDNCYGYWQYAAMREGLPKDVIDDHLREWGIRKTALYSNLIFHLHTFPITQELSDGFRDMDTEFRDECDGLIAQGVKDFIGYTSTPKVVGLESPLGKNGKEAAEDVQRRAKGVIDKELIPLFSQGLRYSPTFIMPPTPK